MNLDGRRYVIVVFFASIGAIYILRLFFMQVVDDHWKNRAREIAEKKIEITPPRATVYDRFSKKIVTNRSYYNLMFVEKNIENLDTARFGEVVGMTKQEVKNRFYKIKQKEGKYFNKNTKRKESNFSPNRPYPFLKDLTTEEIVRIAPRLSEFPGFYEDLTSMRSYPFSGAANIFGYLAETTQKEIDDDKFYRRGSLIGRTGMEKYYEEALRGQKGVKYIVYDALGVKVGAYANGKYDIKSKQANDVKLGLDIELQVYGEKLMQNKRGCIVAIEPSSGEILAMVSAPSFDPNALVGTENIRKNYFSLLQDEGKPLFPRPLQAEYPPGSIFKLLQSLIGLQEGTITVDSGFPCTKSMVGCHNHPMATNLEKAVQYSCNPYYYYVMRRTIQQGKKKSMFADAELGLNKWYNYMKAFGLDQKLDVDISGVRGGVIPNSSYYDKWYGHNQWAFSTIRSIAIGQGEVKVTPLQMANIAALIANKGWFYTPHFVKSMNGQRPEKKYRTKHYGMVDSKHYLPIHEGMRRVVNESGGTGSKARISDIVVCGKTGTAQNPQGEDHSIFISFAPLDKPKIAIVVFIENAGFGGTWAAPTASLMIEKYLKRKVSDKAKEERILNANLLEVKRKRSSH
jgi:penicillin-binding protein 2